MKNRNLKLLDIKKVILNWAGVRLALQNLPRMSWTLRNNNDKSGRFRIKFGMTFCYNNRGFTLIELLVVVLIIGILAAIAVPQYQKVVGKSKAVGLLMATDKLVEAQRLYFLENNEYASSLDDLDIKIPQYNCVRGDSGGPLITCSPYGIIYFHWIERPWRQCCIYQHNGWKGKEICQALTGKKNSPPSDATGGYCYFCQGNCPEFLK